MQPRFVSINRSRRKTRYTDEANKRKLNTWRIMNGQQDKKEEEHALRGQHRHMGESATLCSLYESNHYKMTVAGDVKELRSR